MPRFELIADVFVKLNQIFTDSQCEIRKPCESLKQLIDNRIHLLFTQTIELLPVRYFCRGRPCLLAPRIQRERLRKEVTLLGEVHPLLSDEFRIECHHSISMPFLERIGADLVQTKFEYSAGNPSSGLRISEVANVVVVPSVTTVRFERKLNAASFDPFQLDPHHPCAQTTTSTDSGDARRRHSQTFSDMCSVVRLHRANSAQLLQIGKVVFLPFEFAGLTGSLQHDRVVRAIFIAASKHRPARQILQTVT